MRYGGHCAWLGAGAVTLAAVVAAVVGAPQPSAAESSSALAPVPVPLVSGVTAFGLSSVAFPMGDLGQPDNTFWELFLQRAAGSSWDLRTPPGVASNGGLVVALSPRGGVTVGFLPSQLLRFSPVADSSDGGTHWVPGLLPSALVAAPDVLAEVPSGTSRTTVIDALVAMGSGQHLLAGTGTGAWRTVVTSTNLSQAVRGCAVTRITAVALTTAASSPVLGVQCAQPGLVGVLVRSGSSSSTAGSTFWSNVGPRLTGANTGGATVLRLESSPAGLAGLASVRAGTATALVAFWRGSSATAWSQSARLKLPSGWKVRASAMGGYSGQGEAVLLASGTHLRVAEIARPGTSWAMLPAPPLGTAALAVRGAVTAAFSVSGSKLRVWTSTAGATRWQRTQATTVAVPYGSSS